jgi:hypothetical protein
MEHLRRLSCLSQRQELAKHVCYNDKQHNTENPLKGVQESVHGRTEPMSVVTSRRENREWWFRCTQTLFSRERGAIIYDAGCSADC